MEKRNLDKVVRPTEFSQELAINICVKIAKGMPLTKICRLKNMPCFATVYLWLSQDDKKAFLDMYMRARTDQADTMADEMLEISDDTKRDTMKIIQGGKLVEVENKEWVNRSRLRVETRKWIASKLKPKKYGDKLDIEQKVTIEQPLFPDLTD